MQPTILYIHDPAALLSPEPLCSMWAALSPEGSRAFRLASSRAQRIGDWLLLLDEAYDGRLLENRLRHLCSASRLAQALPPLTKLMGLNPLEVWRTIT